MTPPLQSAHPPWYLWVIWAVVAASCAWSFPSLQAIDDAATIQTFSTPVFPTGPLSSPQAIGWTRITFAVVVFATTARFIRSGALLRVVYSPASRLKSHEVELNGIMTQGFYTTWSWNLLGVTFLLSGAIPLLESAGHGAWLEGGSGRWLLRAALVSFETAAPSALLVSVVVRYALWPLGLSKGATLSFKTISAQMQHNANIIMVLFEVCMLGGLPVLLPHMAVAPVFGLVYILFSWFMTLRWSPRHGPVFLYFFMDTTVGPQAAAMILGLLLVLLTFFGAFVALQQQLPLGDPLTRGAAMLATLSLVCRFRDNWGDRLVFYATSRPPKAAKSA